jgi:hypothetical protein
MRPAKPLQSFTRPFIVGTSRIQVLDRMQQSGGRLAIYEKAPLEKYATRDTPSIHIIGKNGWATLEGVVDSEAERAIAHQRALRVISHVSDNLRTAQESPTSSN